MDPNKPLSPEQVTVSRSYLRELIDESLEREKECVSREKLYRRKILFILGDVKVATPIKQFTSPYVDLTKKRKDGRKKPARE